MYAGFSAQPAISMVPAGDFDSCGLNARRLLPTLSMTSVLKPRAPPNADTYAATCWPSPALQYHRNWLEYRDSTGAIVLAGEHPTEFQLRQLLPAYSVPRRFQQRLFVVSFYRKFQQPGNAVQPLSHFDRCIDDRFER